MPTKKCDLWIALAVIAALVSGWGLCALGESRTRGGRTESLPLPKTARVERRMEITTFNPSDRQYTVDLTFVGKSMTFSPPPLIVRDGEQATIRDTLTQTFVAGRRTENGFAVPIARNLEEGSKFDVLVCCVDGSQVVVDVEATFRGVTGKPENEGELLRVNCQNGRFIQQAKIDELIEVSFGDWKLQATVHDRSKGE